jgi:hypothetical protein
LESLVKKFLFNALATSINPHLPFSNERYGFSGCAQNG